MFKKLSNLRNVVYGELKPTADRYGAEVHRKVRIADVIDIDALDFELGSYALEAHFDFVVADGEHLPQFAVEFDGLKHSTTHDAKKDELCRQVHLALFRADLRSSQDRSGEMNFLSYLVHLWFLALAFKDMQEKGELPPDEPFVASAFLRPDAKSIFDSEFDLIGPARAKISRFCARNSLGEGSLAHMTIGELLMLNQEGQYAALCSLPVGGVKLYGQRELSFKAPSWGALETVPFAKHEIGMFCLAKALSDLLEELKIFDLSEKHVLTRRDEVLEHVEALKKRGFSMLLQMNEL